MRDLTIRSAMSACPVVVEEDTSLNQARSLMYRLRIRHLPVVAGNRLVGILTDRDVNLAAYLANDLLDVDAMTAGDACIQDPYTTHPDASLSKVARTLADKHIGSALVVEDEELVGIFTANDSLKFLSVMLGETSPRLERDRLLSWALEAN